MNDTLAPTVGESGFAQAGSAGSIPDVRMTTNDVVDALLYAKLADGRIFQVCLSQETAKWICECAAIATGELKLLDTPTDIEWSRVNAEIKRLKAKADMGIPISDGYAWQSRGEP